MEHCNTVTGIPCEPGPHKCMYTLYSREIVVPRDQEGEGIRPVHSAMGYDLLTFLARIGAGPWVELPTGGDDQWIGRAAGWLSTRGVRELVAAASPFPDRPVDFGEGAEGDLLSVAIGMLNYKGPERRYTDDSVRMCVKVDGNGQVRPGEEVKVTGSLYTVPWSSELFKGVDGWGRNVETWVRLPRDCAVTMGIRGSRGVVGHVFDRTFSPSTWTGGILQVNMRVRVAETAKPGAYEVEFYVKSHTLPTYTVIVPYHVRGAPVERVVVPVGVPGPEDRVKRLCSALQGGTATQIVEGMQLGSMDDIDVFKYAVESEVTLGRMMGSPAGRTKLRRIGESSKLGTFAQCKLEVGSCIRMRQDN